jgi:predicted nucleotidyltransferase
MLDRLVEAVSEIKGVVAVILFGSYARGDYDEYSDYDILVLFRDRESMWRGWDELFQRVGALRLLIHLIPKTLEEFWGGEPTFLSQVLAHGRLLLARHPLELPAALLGVRRMRLILYNMRGLSQREKSRLTYRLYGRRSPEVKGLVDEIGGLRLSEGCLLIPEEHTAKVIETLRRHGAEVETMRILVETS